MLRLPRFDTVAPTSVSEVVAALQKPGARLVAGGTDIIPNLKHRLDSPPLLVSLSRVDELRAISVVDSPGSLCIGAGARLSEIAADPAVLQHAPSLAQAAGIIASPLIRNMGTLGGNINLDTRCRYVNQTQFWRSAIGGCLKAEGDLCHVVPGGRNCVAAMSSDCVPVLISLDASVVLVGSGGRRELPLSDYFTADGLRNTTRADDELTTEVRIPLAQTPRRAAYAKWTVRKSIDYPLVSVALRFDLSRDDVGGEVMDLRVVVGVLGARPRVVSRLDAALGRPLRDPALATTVADRVHQQCKPLENVPYEAPYRRQMIRVHTRRAIQELARRG